MTTSFTGIKRFEDDTRIDVRALWQTTDRKVHVVNVTIWKATQTVTLSGSDCSKAVQQSGTLVTGPASFARVTCYRCRRADAARDINAELFTPTKC